MLSHWGGRKTTDISCFRFGSCMCRSGFGERIFTVYALYIRKWSTVLQHRTMVSTCRTHWVILGHWHLSVFIEPVCIFAVKTTHPTRKIDPVSMSPLTYLHAASPAHVVDSNCRTMFQYPMILRHLILRSRKFSKPRYLYLELDDCSEIWQSCTSAAVLRCCRCADQISEIIYTINLADSSVWIPVVTCKIWSVKHIIN